MTVHTLIRAVIRTARRTLASHIPSMIFIWIVYLTHYSSNKHSVWLFVLLFVLLWSGLWRVSWAIVFKAYLSAHASCSTNAHLKLMFKHHVCFHCGQMHSRLIVQADPKQKNNYLLVSLKCTVQSVLYITVCRRMSQDCMALYVSKAVSSLRSVCRARVCEGW